MAEQHDESESPSGPDKTEPEAKQVEQVEAQAAEAELVSESEAAELAPAAPKKKKKKRALDAEAEPSRDRNRRLREEVAGGRRTKQGARVAIPARNLEAGEIVDDALARTTQAAGEWLKKNANVVQWVVIVGLVGWVGFAIYNYRAGRAAEQASAKLSTAVRAEGARVGSDDTKADPQTGLVETRPAFATEELRLKAAEQQYRSIAEGGSTSAATFAKLGLASVLYDQGKFADAKAAYQAVKDSKLASLDLAVKGRALEGIGMSLEGAGDKDGALKAFGELSNVDGLGFNALGAYHQARLAFAAGNTEKAKEYLKDAQKRLDTLAGGSDAKKALGGGATGYLQQSVRDLQRRVDPTSVPASSGSTLTAEQIQQLSEQMGVSDGSDKGAVSSEKLKELLRGMSKGAGDAPNVPAPPASAP
ncbi:MAG TPA: tetratricopeptide repeat protein [Polyangiaceae bacterium]|nr:tetratricopeptide repeat protein [Polyangiaceae bacterium]